LILSLQFPNSQAGYCWISQPSGAPTVFCGTSFEMQEIVHT
jgi:hypothetical protein